MPVHTPDKELSPQERLRYGRHLSLPEVGLTGQTRLLGASVILVGVGGLGSPASLYLAAAGVGRIGLVDFDRVELSNLQRQVLYGQTDLGRPKVEAARERLLDLNPGIQVDAINLRLDRKNIDGVLVDYDLVLDGSDNFQTRYLVNDACVRLKKVNIQASVSRFNGQLSVYDSRTGPCYRCVFPVPPPPDAVPSCGESGVLGVLPGVMGALQAAEAVKYFLGLGAGLEDGILLFDAMGGTFKELRIQKDPLCAACGKGPPVEEEMDVKNPLALRPETVKAKLDRGETFFLLDVREPEEFQLAHLGGTLIPLRELPTRLSELPRDKDILIYCHHGVRSLHALYLLREHGFDRSYHLSGGIDAWSLSVDPKVPRY